MCVCVQALVLLSLHHITTVVITIVISGGEKRKKERKKSIDVESEFDTGGSESKLLSVNTCEACTYMFYAFVCV